MSSSIDERFATFNEQNPKVLADLEELADKLVKRGRTRIGIKCLWEVLRYRYLTETIESHGTYKLCNDYTSRYARLMIERNPKLRAVIELRSLRNQEEPMSADLQYFADMLAA